MGLGFGSLQDEYGGTEVTSYERGNFVHPETLEGDYSDLEPSKDPNPERVDLNNTLENHILDTERGIYFVDDHQHALTGWIAAYEENLLPGRTLLEHYDRHLDCNSPQHFNPPKNISEAQDKIADGLRIDQFIVPAVQWGIVDTVETWGVHDDITTHKIPDPQNYDSKILDIDIDVFQGIASTLENKVRDPEFKFSHKDYEVQLNYFYNRMAEKIHESDFTTVATSPGYIMQDSAINHIEGIMGEYEKIEQKM